MNEKEVIELFYTFFNGNKRPSAKTAESYVHNAVRYVEGLLRDDVDKNAEPVRFYAAAKANGQYCYDMYMLSNVERVDKTVTLAQCSNSQKLSLEYLNAIKKDFLKTGKCIECGSVEVITEIYTDMCSNCYGKFCTEKGGN